MNDTPARHPAPDRLIHHAGWVMAQATVDVAESGSRLQPCAVITKDEARRILAFEATSDDEAIRAGRASLESEQARFDLWAFAYQTTLAGSFGPEDALIVAAWTHGMPEPAIFVQRFLPEEDGGFALIGAMMAEKCPPSDLQRVAQCFLDGALDHPKGEMWRSWRLP